MYSTQQRPLKVQYGQRISNEGKAGLKDNAYKKVIFINQMSEYFRKYIRKEHYAVHFSQISFKTYFNNCILNSLERRHWRQTQQDDWNIYWCEKQFIPETLDKNRGVPNTRVNHFRNYYEICRKDLLVKNLKRYKKQLEKEGRAEEANEYNFFPLTYNMPSEYPIFYEEFKKTKEKQKAVWIMKPIGKSQGKGIFLFRQISEIAEWSDPKQQPEPYIVQRYIMEPLLIGGKKFDMRIYALCTSYQPLVVYLSRSGFGRFTHMRYDIGDLDNTEAHLTNVAVQKRAENYDEERGGKWLLDKLRLYLTSKYGADRVDQCFYNVQQIIIKTLSSVTKVMMNDKRCFELYGFDILIDANLRPWLIEVNGSPSMTANTPIDHALKVGILDDVFTILDIQKLLTGEEQQVGGFDLIYKAKPVKILFGKNNFSMLGCLNNREQQLKKLAKAVALKFSHPQKKKEQTAPSGPIAAQRRAWGTNSNAAKAKQAPKRFNNSVEPSRLPKVVQTQTHVKFPEINSKMDANNVVKRITSNLADNSRYKITR